MAVPLSDHLDIIPLNLRNGLRLLLCCDFDGTLVPIQDHPDSCYLDSKVRGTLAELSRENRLHVAIMSGRSLADLKARVGLDAVSCAGNHGLEIDSALGTFRHPAALAARSELETVIRALQSELAEFPGVWVEDKGMTASVHYRLAKPTSVSRIVNRIDQVLGWTDKSGTFLIRGGKAVREVRPTVEWNKGTAVRWLMERLTEKGPPIFPIYLGDDDTDEDAFRVVANTGMGVCVGERLATAAKYMIPDPTSVQMFLKWFANRLRDCGEFHSEPLIGPSN